MNGPEILHLIRHDLQRAIACRGRPPTLRPLDISPWLAMSVLQKAIRRGREDLALSAAATLMRDAPDRLWRRIGCVAYEDVGVASLEAWPERRSLWRKGQFEHRSSQEPM
jgi:hypothetical protein